jgi:hypothetical protein
VIRGVKVDESNDAHATAEPVNATGFTVHGHATVVFTAKCVEAVADTNTTTVALAIFLTVARFTGLL